MVAGVDTDWKACCFPEGSGVIIDDSVSLSVV